jgi:hypothetical protein
MAIEILVEELKLLRSLSPSDEAGNRVLEAYIHESWGKDVLLKGAVVPVAGASKEAAGHDVAQPFGGEPECSADIGQGRK